MTDLVRVQTGRQLEMRPCAYQPCGVMFTPRHEAQVFHLPKCRAAYSREVGLQGEVVNVTKLMRGRVSVVLHFPAEAEAKAIAIVKGGKYQVVKVP